MDPPAGQDKTKIIIYGNDQESVKKARESVELIDEEFNLTQVQAAYLTDYRNSNVLDDFRTTSELLKVIASKDKYVLYVIGTRTAVRMARYQFEAIKEFINSATDLVAEVQTAKNQLFDFKRQYNMHRGDRGGQGDGRGFGGRDGGRGSGRGRGDRDGGRGGGRGGRGSGDVRVATDSLASLPPAQVKKADKTPLPPAAPTAPSTNNKNGKSETSAPPKNDSKKSKNVETVTSQLEKVSLTDAATKDGKNKKGKQGPKNDVAVVTTPSTAAPTVTSGGAPVATKESKKKGPKAAEKNDTVNAPVSNASATVASTAVVSTAPESTNADTAKPKNNRKRNNGKGDGPNTSSPAAEVTSVSAPVTVPPSTASNASKDIVVPPSNLEKRVKKDRGNKASTAAPAEQTAASTSAPSTASANTASATVTTSTDAVAGGKEKPNKDSKKMTIRDAKESKKEKDASKSAAPGV